MNNGPASLGHHLLQDIRRHRALSADVIAVTKIQAPRRAANFRALFETSENASLFLPEGKKYVKPAFLDIIHAARVFIGDLNTKRGAVRDSSLFGVSTPECAHGLGCADWLLHCRGVKFVSEQHLLRLFAPHALSGDQIAYLSTVRLALAMYLHDTVEDNRKVNHRITPVYVARRALTAVLQESFINLLFPVLKADIQAFTDKAGLHGQERLAAQKIPPQKEYETLREMGVLTEKSFGTGPIGTGKFIDKAHSGTLDLLVLLTGRKSFFKDMAAFEKYVVPRLDIIDSLHIPESYKNLYLETAERIIKRLKTPLKKPLSPEASQKIILHELARIKNVLEGAPHVPINKKAYWYGAQPR